MLDRDEDIIVDPGLRKPIDEMLCYIEREVFLKLKMMTSYIIFMK